MFPLHRNQSINLLKFCLRVGLKYYLNITLCIMGEGGEERTAKGREWLYLGNKRDLNALRA